MAAMLVLVAAFTTLHHRNQAPARREDQGRPQLPHSPGPRRGIAVALAGLTIVFAVISAVQVYRIGDSGARAAWSETQYVTPASGDQPDGQDDG